MHGGKSPGAPIGNNNALKHGLYSAEAIARRREVAEHIRSMRGLVKEVVMARMMAKAMRQVRSEMSALVAS